MIQRATVAGIGLLLLSISACHSFKQLPLDTELIPLQPRVQKDSTTFTAGPNQLQYNASGLWELYLEGNAIERGWNNGLLTQELIQKQERAFMQTLHNLVPSPKHQWLVRGFIRFFNRDIDRYLQPEYKAEIQAMASFASSHYNYLAPPFRRFLYFHAAHDLGHALRDLALVGCTSLAVWGDKSSDGKLLIGRNFDFYAGDDFAQQKMVVFIRPEKGIPHAMVAWPGMVGAVSGMNLSGLTITINAGKSNLPHKAKTPISLLTREILQHAHTIEQAIDIAAKRQVFVAESILIGSAEDRKAVILEISPQKLEIYEVDHERGQLISTNHFKSEGYQQDKRNLEQVANSHSLYRFQRVSELIINQKQLNPQKMAHLLRDRMGLQEQELGMGNEKAINQLIAHHSVIFQPEDRIMWVSTAPYQLGEFVGYRLDQIFASKSIDEPMVRPDTALTLAADPFSKSQAFRNYEHYRTGFNSIQSMDKSQHLTHEELKNFQALNPSFWKTHAILGKYYADRKQTALALHHYTEAVKLEVSSINERRALLKRIKRLQKRAD